MKNKPAQTKRHFIDGKTIVGSDPAKDKHKAIAISGKRKSAWQFVHV
ncbi:hypothetical protein BMS3Abin05_00684 [bacterium BMS3Abin05]|nr:hypothetical protein BMS3Abin05_00684 [bacterium BMS3Abin05]